MFFGVRNCSEQFESRVNRSIYVTRFVRRFVVSGRFDTTALRALVVILLMTTVVQLTYRVKTGDQRFSNWRVSNSSQTLVIAFYRFLTGDFKAANYALHVL